jgi:para-nitrobenzyl esterase
MGAGAAGIAIGATSGSNRLMPPQKPKPRTDVFPAVWWGNSAPQIMGKRYANAYSSFADHWDKDVINYKLRKNEKKH